jgi:hypothetical protein
MRIMGDRCHLQLTLRREDLDRFGAILNEPAGSTWWNEEYNEPAPGIVEVGIHEANYALFDEREQAAREGIPFFGNHGEGGDYAGCAFAGIGGRQIEVYTDRDGLLCVQLDESMRLLTDLGHIREYLEMQRAVEHLFGIPPRVSDQFAPEPESAEVGEHYVLHVIGDVEPQLLGPFASEVDRDHTAVEVRRRCGDEDGLYRLDLTAGLHPLVYPYSSSELEKEEPNDARNLGDRPRRQFAA